MAGTKNDTLIGKNADFSQAGAPNATSGEANGLNTDGQMWIGSTALNAGGTHINVGTLTSPDSSITFGYSSPNITAVVNGATVGQTITGDTGGALSPTAGNWNILSTASAGSSTGFSGSGSTLTFNTTDAFLNTLIGQLAGNGSLATAGAGNVSLGYATLNALTTGVSNVGIGYSALTDITTGSRNTAVGYGTLLGTSVTSFTDNTALGNNAGNLIRGNQNTLLGSRSGEAITTGANNIAVGYNSASAYTSSESSNIIIGNLGTVAESNVIKIGSQGSGSGQQDECYIAGIVGVTNSNPQTVTIDSTTGQLGVATASDLFKTTTYNTSDSPALWTKDARTVRIQLFMWAGGGAGASGRKGTTAASGGGGGGGAGSTVFIDAPASFFGPTENVVIGAGGTGGISQTTDATNGIQGSLGGNSSFGNIVAQGGSRGNAGATGTATGGIVREHLSINGFINLYGNGGTGNQAASANASDIPVGGVSLLPSGGAGGSGANSTTERQAGNGGNIQNSALTNLVVGGIGGLESTGINGTAGNPGLTTTGQIPTGGSGGGGGGGYSTGAGGNTTGGTGGNGAVPGGGGGGGGGGISAVANSGAGGNGGDGKVIVIEYF